MAKTLRVLVKFLVIALAVSQINAAALQINGSTDLGRSETASSYHLSENEPNDHVIVDLFDPSPADDTKFNIRSMGDDSIDKTGTPFVQVVINQNQSNASGSTSTEQSVPNDENPIVETPQSTVSPLQLIPPASVNASIDKLENDSTQKQGQIIIRYAVLSHV